MTEELSRGETERAVPEIGIHAPDFLYLGSRAVLRVLLQVARGPREAAPLAGARLAAVLDPRGAARLRLTEAVSDANGVAVLDFVVPGIPAGRCWLTIRAETPHGPVELRHDMEVRADARLIAALDARRVPAGGEARVRFALLRALSSAPLAGAAIEVTATDPRGNRILARALTTDRCGGAELRLPIAAGARAGRWTVEAVHGECTVRRVFHVVRGPAGAKPEEPALRVAFFPAGGGLAPEVERKLFLHLAGPGGSPAPGTIELALAARGALPEVRLGPEGGIATDAGGWARVAVRVPAAYLTPAPVGARELAYAARGFRDARLLHPATAAVRYRAISGDVVSEGEAAIDAFRLEAPLTLALDREIAEAGAAIAVEACSGAEEGLVHVDLLQAGQVVRSRTLRSKEGRAAGVLDLPADACGPLEVRAARMLPFGWMVEDARLVWARPRARLAVTLAASGVVCVRDRNGAPAAASVDLTLAPGADWVARVLELGGHAPLVDLRQFPEFLPILRELALGEEGLSPIGRRAYLALRPAYGRYGWSVDPAAERRRGLISQLLRVFSNLVAYLERHAFAAVDPATGAWGYVPDLLERIVREGRLLREDLLDFSGRAYEMKDLEALDPLFSFPFLARAITGVRIRRVYEALAEYGRRHERWSWMRRAAWEFPADVAEQLVAQGLLEAETLSDAWGHALEIRRRDAPEERAGLPSGLGMVRVVSGGPDGVYSEGSDPDEPLLSVHEMRATPDAPAPDVATPAAPARPVAQLREEIDAAEPDDGPAGTCDAEGPVRAWTIETDAELGAAQATIPPDGEGDLVAFARSADGACGTAVIEISGTPASPPATIEDPTPESAAFGVAMVPGNAISLELPQPPPAAARVRRIAGPRSLLRAAWIGLREKEVRDLDDALALAVSAALAVPSAGAAAQASAARAWQEILAREEPEGSFSPFGGGPGHPVFAARVLLAVADLRATTLVDPAVIDRIALALQAGQESDGSWSLDRTEGGWDALTQRFVPTAYVLGALAIAGAHGAVADQAAAFLRRRLRDAQADPYALAFAVWALLAHVPGDGTLSRECERLGALGHAESERECRWTPAGATLFGTWGADAGVEATAIAVLALQRAPAPSSRAAAGVAHLLRMRGADGAWGAPHVTEMVLRALATGRDWPADSGTAARLRWNGVERDLPPTHEGDPEAPEISWPIPPGARIEVEVVSGDGPPFQVLIPGMAGPKSQLVPALKCTRRAVAAGEGFELEIGLDHTGGFPVWRSTVEMALPAGAVPERALLDRWVDEGKLLAWSACPGGVRLEAGTIRPKEKRAWKLACTVATAGRIVLGPVRARERYGVQAWAVGPAVELEVG